MMMRKWVVGLGCASVMGCSAVHKATAPDSLSREQIARIPPDQMAPVNQARLDLSKAEDEAARRDLGVKSASQEVEVAKQDVKVGQTELDRTKALLNKANFDRNSQAGQQAQRDSAVYQAQLDAGQAHLKAANAALDLATAQKKESEGQRDLAKAKLDLAEATALKNSGDPEGRNVNVDTFRSKVDDRLKNVEKARSDIARLQSEADRERMAWQVADQRYNRVRGVGGANGTTR